MKKFLLLLFTAFSGLYGFSQTTFIGNLDAADGTYDRPEEGMPPTTLSTVGTNVYYEVILFTVATPGLITITSNSGFDNFGVLYGPGGFNAAAPLNNALQASDDLSGTNFGFTYNFTTPGTYYLVVSSYKNNVTGPYSVTLTPVTTVPVKLVSFTAEKATTSTNLLSWSTAEELGVEKYQVQRSVDGKNFVDLSAATLSAINSSVKTSYNFTDKAPIAGLNFYRLKIVEKNGRFTQSNVAVVNNRKGSSSIKVFPNPAVNYLYIETKASNSGKASISIINVAGGTVFSKEFVASQQPVFTVDVRKLTAGKYFVKTIINNEQTITAFVKD